MMTGTRVLKQNNPNLFAVRRQALKTNEQYHPKNDVTLYHGD